MARQRTGRTLAEDVHDHLRDEIVGGRRRPGTRLHLKDLAADQGVSLSVVREAVTRLAAEGLVESTPQVGFRVRTLSLDDLADLTWARVNIEAIALRDSIANGDLAWEAEVVASHHRLARTPARLDGAVNREWMIAHAAYHASLTAACTSQHLLRLRQQLFDASELYRYWSATLAPADPDRRLAEVEDQHRDILDATLARDADRAVALLTEHLQETAATLARAAKTDEEPIRPKESRP